MDIEITAGRGDERFPVLGHQRESTGKMKNTVHGIETQLIFGITVNEMRRVIHESTYCKACVNSQKVFHASMNIPSLSSTRRSRTLALTR